MFRHRWLLFQQARQLPRAHRGRESLHRTQWQNILPTREGVKRSNSKKNIFISIVTSSGSIEWFLNYFFYNVTIRADYRDLYLQWLALYNITVQLYSDKAIQYYNTIVQWQGYRKDDLMWLEIKIDLMWWWWWVVVGVEGENRNKLGACQFSLLSRS